MRQPLQTSSRKRLALLLPGVALFLASALAVSAESGKPADKAAPPASAASPGSKDAARSFFDLTSKTLDGKPQPLSAYRGKVVLVVNTASQCGYTPQYEGLEKLYKDYKDRGVVVLGFPSNDFGEQEPGSAPEIAKFCKARFGVTFPLFEKTRTKGAEASPVWKLLAAKHGEPQWNFHKYLVGRDGQILGAYRSEVTPQGPELQSAIEAALSAPSPSPAKE